MGVEGEGGWVGRKAVSVWKHRRAGTEAVGNGFRMLNNAGVAGRLLGTCLTTGLVRRNSAAWTEELPAG